MKLPQLDILATCEITTGREHYKKGFFTKKFLKIGALMSQYNKFSLSLPDRSIHWFHVLTPEDPRHEQEKAYTAHF